MKFIDQIVWNLQIILTIVSLPIHEHWTFSFIQIFSFFSQFFQFSKYKFCTSFVKYISKCFILFDAIISRNVFLILFSDYSLQIYGNRIKFCICNFLLNSFNSSNSFLVNSLGFSISKILFSEQRKFHLVLSNLDAFHFFLLPNYIGQNIVMLFIIAIESLV